MVEDLWPKGGIARDTPVREQSMNSAIPVISLGPIARGAREADSAVARELKPVLQEWGAFLLVDHGVPAATIEGAFNAAHRFFALPLERRLKVKVNKHN